MFVKSTPSRREKRLMTESQALAAEAAWEKYQRAQSLKRKRDLFVPLRVTSAVINAAIAAADGNQARAFYELAMSCARSAKEAQHARYAAHLACLFAPSDKDRRVWANEAARYELRNFSNAGITRAAVRGGDSLCSVCAALVGREVLVNSSEAEQLLPPSGCARLARADGTCLLHFSPLI